MLNGIFTCSMETEKSRRPRRQRQDIQTPTDIPSSNIDKAWYHPIMIHKQTAAMSDQSIMSSLQVFHNTAHASLSALSPICSTGLTRTYLHSVCFSFSCFVFTWSIFIYQRCSIAFPSLILPLLEWTVENPSSAW